VHARVRAALDASGCRFTVRRHADIAGPVRGPDDVARALGITLDRITKTLFVVERRAGGRTALICCRMPVAVDFARVAALLDYGRIELGSADALRATLGYPRHGVSPLGAPPTTPVVIDEGLLDASSILVGAGEIGEEIELAPADLVEISHGIVTAVTA